MRSNRIIVSVFMIMYIICFAGLACAAEDVPQEMQLTTKNIFIKNNRVLEPASLTSNLGTTVVWINTSAFPVEIIFIGKKVALACGSPMNFSIDKEGAFHSAIIPRGGTASLCFIEKGEFTYKVGIFWDIIHGIFSNRETGKEGKQGNNCDRVMFM